MVDQNPTEISGKIIDQVKKSGEFDKFRRELVDGIAESNELQKLFEKCRGIVEESLYSTSYEDLQKFGINKLREHVKAEIKRRKLVDNSMKHVLEQHMLRIRPQLTHRMEEIVRAELGMPKEIKQELPDANLELVDMEASKKPKQDKGNPNLKQVSSGGSGCSSTNLNTPNTNSPRRPSSADRKRKSPGNDSQRSKSITTGNNNTEDEEQKIDVEDTKDPGLELEKFANSITASSSCTSSLSCNASEDGLQPVQSPIDVNAGPSTSSSSTSHINNNMN